MRILRRWHTPRNGAPNPVETLQLAITENGARTIDETVAALAAMLRQQLWQDRKSAHGAAFTSFAEFALALQPEGLGIRTNQAILFLRKLMVDGGHLAEWTDLLKHVIRPRGRPKENLANSDDFIPTYKLTRTTTGIDRLLLTLDRHHPELFMKVCKGECSAHAAALAAGLVSGRKARFRYGVCDFAEYRKLSDQLKLRLLRDLFREVDIGIQCEFLARDIAPAVSVNLSQRWRSRIAGNATTDDDNNQNP